MTALRTAAVSRAPATTALRRVVAVLLVLTAGVNALYLVGLIASNGQNSPFVNVGLGLATQWIPATVFWLVAAHTRFRRLPVVLAAAGVTVSALGDSYYSLAMDADGYLASPSPADPAYLLFYPLLVAALVVLVRPRLRGVGGLVLLETAVATVGASAVLAVLLDPVIVQALAGEDPLADAVAIAYPLFDLMLLAVIAGIASAPTIRAGSRWAALVAGLLITAFGDIGYALLGTLGTYLAGTPLDATWAIGLALTAWWVAGMAEPHVDDDRPIRRAALPIPALALLTGLALLVIGTQVALSPLAVVLAALTVGLGATPLVFRQALTRRMLAAQDEALRRLTALDQAKSDILVTLNHEFRTPLTSITGHVELLLDGVAGELPESAVRMLETVERNGARLQTLIDETLTSSRLDEGGAAFDLAPTALPELVMSSVRRVRGFADDRGVDLHVAPTSEPLEIEADPLHLEQALVNILDNAVKFSAPGGSVVVDVERNGRDAVVRIRDEGIGVPAADLPSLVTRFYRASNVQNAAIPGVGLGLSIADRVVAAHGGALRVTSLVGVGTTVTVRLPLRRTRRARGERT